MVGAHRRRHGRCAGRAAVAAAGQRGGAAHSTCQAPACARSVIQWLCTAVCAGPGSQRRAPTHRAESRDRQHLQEAAGDAHSGFPAHTTYQQCSVSSRKACRLARRSPHHAPLAPCPAWAHAARRITAAGERGCSRRHAPGHACWFTARHSDDGELLPALAAGRDSSGLADCLCCASLLGGTQHGHRNQPPNGSCPALQVSAPASTAAGCRSAPRQPAPWAAAAYPGRCRGAGPGCARGGWAAV
jgi:hypothetical protein